MKPVDQLMTEHRLIERAIALMGNRLDRLKKYNEVDVGFIDIGVDFLRTYADRTHHGKEEDILFRELALKQLAPDHRKAMEELGQEHNVARRTIARLIKAKEVYSAGNTGVAGEIGECLDVLTRLYPAHIEKEEIFFLDVAVNYYTQEEETLLMQRFYDFDRQMIHEKYGKVVEAQERIITEKNND